MAKKSIEDYVRNFDGRGGIITISSNPDSVGQFNADDAFFVETVVRLMKNWKIRCVKKESVDRPPQEQYMKHINRERKELYRDKEGDLYLLTYFSVRLPHSNRDRYDLPKLKVMQNRSNDIVILNLLEPLGRVGLKLSYQNTYNPLPKYQKWYDRIHNYARSRAEQCEREKD